MGTFQLPDIVHSAYMPAFRKLSLKPNIGSEAAWDSLKQKKSIMSCFACGSNGVWRNSFIPLSITHLVQIIIRQSICAYAVSTLKKALWSKGFSRTPYSAYHLPNWSQQQVPARIFTPTPVFPGGSFNWGSFLLHDSFPSQDYKSLSRGGPLIYCLVLNCYSWQQVKHTPFPRSPVCLEPLKAWVVLQEVMNPNQSERWTKRSQLTLK